MISLIAAVSENNVIGNKGTIPWPLSADLKHFAAVTKNHTVIMGRKTYESIFARLGKPLPERKNIVISSQSNYQAPGCLVVHSLEEAVEKAGEGELFIIGGEQIYRQALPIADKLYLTKVHVTCEGDASFPTWNTEEWELEKSELHKSDEKNQYDYTFLTYVRKIT